MSAAQLDLFALEPVGAHRKRGRSTSTDAAKSMSGDVLTNQQRDVLQVVAANVCHGATAYEVATQLGTQQNVMARRLTDLGELGFAQRRSCFTRNARGEVIEEVFQSRAGGSGRGCDVWFATDKGREWLHGTVDVKTGSYL